MHIKRKVDTRGDRVHGTVVGWAAHLALPFYRRNKRQGTYCILLVEERERKDSSCHI